MGFFDNLSKKASETYKATTDKTNKMAKEMRLKSNISECKSIINSVYTEIGKKVYEKHNLGESINIAEDLKAEIAKIDEYASKIEKMNEEMREINNMKLCSTCAAQISIESKFCPKCGAKQEEVQAEEVKAEEPKAEENQEVQLVETAPAEVTVVEPAELPVVQPEAALNEEESKEPIEEVVEEVIEAVDETTTEENK